MTKTIITSAHSPENDIKSEEDMHAYLCKVKNLPMSDFFIELNNVLAAKHNITAIPSSIVNFQNNQRLISTLNDKIFLICILVFGQDKISNFDDGNLRSFYGLVQKIDSELARLDLDSEMHGRAIILELKKHL